MRTLRGRPSAVAYLVPLLLFGATAAPAGSDLWDLPIDKLMEIKVRAASRADEAIADSPTALTVYGRDEFRALGVRYLHELLPYVPGFQVSLDVAVAGQRHALSGRGSVEFHSPGILVLRDGRRINDDYTRGAPLFARWISLENVSRVEIIRGPGSALYGSNAVVGVINLVTADSNRNYALVEAGNPGLLRAALAVSESAGSFEIALFGETLTDDGEWRPVFDRHGRATHSEDPRRFHDVGLTIRRGSTELAVHQQRRRLDDFHSLGGNVGNGSTPHDARLLSAAVRHEARIGDTLDTAVTFDFRKADWDFLFLQAPDGTGPFDSGDFLLGGNLDQEIFSLSVENRADFGSSGTLVFGGEWTEGRLPRAHLVSTYDLANPAIAFGEPRRTPLRFARDRDSRTIGAFAEHTWSPRDPMHVRLGIRLDDDRFSELTVSPRAGFQYLLNERHRLSALAGRAFRAPGLGELFLQNQPVILGNPDLDATELDTLELGYRRVTPETLLAFSLFRNETENAIVSVPTEADPAVAQFRNSGEQRTTGGEFELIARFGNGSRLRVGGTHLFENETNLAASPGSPAPEDFFAETFGFVTLRQPLGTVDLMLGLTYRDAVDALPDQGSIVLVDARGTFRISESLLGWVQVHNALDRDFDTPASGAGIGTDPGGVMRRDIPARGREWSVGLQKNF